MADARERPPRGGGSRLNEVERLFSRADDDLGAARSLARDGYYSQAISRAYYAAFYAAEAALDSIGETRSKHSGVIAAFGRLVIKDGGLDREVGDSLRRLFEERNRADYGAEPADSPRADRAIDQAAQLVRAIKQWVSAN